MELAMITKRNNFDINSKLYKKKDICSHKSLLP